ncbi:interleukin-1 receptor antagonist protein isoform X1 [Antechinus flavipes]|uniref:interleukin-1 receptor antagonist protein isoform X1 n=2 Tax=Antechinus flavipes TaxID=38775 RepID=UPI0022356D6C|nr:interleukin-1 receptor antagonist protein isoform X1 [Antechinus flavipes]
MKLGVCLRGSLIAFLLFSFHSETASLPFKEMGSRKQTYRIWDVYQKIFYMRNNQLVAGYLQGQNTNLEEKIDMISIEPHSVLLGIHDGSLCLSCVKSGNTAHLQLEEVNIADLDKDRNRSKRFTFIKTENGSTSSFESAACPGWFLCTQMEADQPVGLCNTQEENIITKFYFQME